MALRRSSRIPDIDSGKTRNGTPYRRRKSNTPPHGMSVEEPNDQLSPVQKPAQRKTQHKETHVSNKEPAGKVSPKLTPQRKRQHRVTSPDLRIVLLGKAGTGKSESGNTILGKTAFQDEVSIESVTKSCEKCTGEVAGRSVTVINTPDLFDTEKSVAERKSEIEKCIELSGPGPHAFLLVICLKAKFTEEERNAVKLLQETFGEEVLKYTMVLLTHGEAMEGKSVNDVLGKIVPLSSLIKTFRDRYHVFNNNTEHEDKTQVVELVEKIEAMVEKNGGSFYTTDMYQEAQEKTREVEEERKRLEHERAIANERKQKEQLQVDLQNEMNKNKTIEGEVQQERRMRKEAEKRKREAETEAQEEKKMKIQAIVEMEEERKQKQNAEMLAEMMRREVEAEKKKIQEAREDLKEERRSRVKAEKRMASEKVKRMHTERELEKNKEQVPPTLQKLALVGGLVGATIATGGVAATGTLGGAAAAAVGGVSSVMATGLAMLHQVRKIFTQDEVQETERKEDRSSEESTVDTDGESEEEHDTHA